nr:DUF3810 family protein [Caldalkalibacillus mannanilyticus]
MKLSKVMSYQGIGGIYFPFTGEANVNILRPEYMLPFTATHEMAHQRGFAREDEANFVGYLAATMHPDYDFQYSGVMVILQTFMYIFEEHDQETYQELKKKCSPGVARDMGAWEEYLRQYQGWASQTTDRMNHIYLQMNAQSDGIQSYGRVADLLYAYYQEAF